MKKYYKDLGKKVTIIVNKIIPFGSYSTINIFGILFTKNKKGILTNRTVNHELIHTAQMKELGYIGFYLWYGIEYLFIRLFHKKQGDAYHDVSFEEEAYANYKDMTYLQNRKHYAWFKYLKVKSND